MDNGQKTKASTEEAFFVFHEAVISPVHADDHMVHDFHAQDFARRYQAFRHETVALARGRVAGRMVVQADDAHGVVQDRPFEHFSRGRVRRCQVAMADLVNAGHVSLRVDGHDVKIFVRRHVQFQFAPDLDRFFQSMNGLVSHGVFLY